MLQLPTEEGPGILLLDDMALREALRRFTEFWEIDWNESNFLDCNGEEWNI